MPSYYYRYTGDAEKAYIDSQRLIQSLSGLTYLTPDYYDSAGEAERLLAMPARPIWRIGPIPGETLPEVDVSPRRVVPRFGKTGGGREIAVRGAIPYPEAARLK